MTFALRYRNLMSEMKQEGITIDDAEAAWFYKQKLGLSELQKQMMETTLGADTEDYTACERESIRLFKRMHLGGGGQQHRPGGPGGQRPGLTHHALRRHRGPGSSTTASVERFEDDNPFKVFRECDGARGRPGGAVPGRD